MYHFHYLNPVSPRADALWSEGFQKTGEISCADAILVRSTSMHDLPLPANLLAIARAGAGVNNIPLENCTQLGIPVFNTPGANADSVAELTLCAMLLGCRDVVGGIQWVQKAVADGGIVKRVEEEKSRFAGSLLRAKTIGIIGLGAVGGRVANLCCQMGIRVYGFDPAITVAGAWNLDRRVIRVESLDAICCQCDVISLHLPLLSDTRHMINGEILGKMRPGTILVNMARDALVDDEAMAQGLRSGRIKTYITDFPNDKTAAMPGCIPIPHLGASTREAEDRCAIMAVTQLMDYLENGNLRNCVNFPDCHLDERIAPGRLTILHRKILPQLQATIRQASIPVLAMQHKEKAGVAVTILDLEAPASAHLVKKLEEMEGVLKVRVFS